MFGIGLIGVSVALIVLSTIGYVVYRAGRSIAFAVGGGEAIEPAREWQAVLAVRVLALLVGVVLAAVTWNLGANGTGAMLSLAVLGLCVLLGTAIGETVVRPPLPAGARSASLTPRRVRDYLPWTAPVVGVELVVLLGLMLVTTLTASDDELGRARELACTGPSMSQGHSPYPGSFYTGPLAVVLVLVLGAGALAAHRVVQRPRGMAGTDGADDRLRRNSLDMVVAAAGVAIAFPLAGLALTTGSTLLSMPSATPTCAPGWFPPVGVALMVISLVALATVAHLLGRLVLVRSPRA